jgi:nicotinate-nucleotide adenylyltransferase
LRLGILGGAFNPPHIGHLVCAQEGLVQMKLGEVLFVPAARPPHRELEDDPGPEVRLELVELAIAGDERFAVSGLELDREGPSYTVDTLRELRSRRPDDELFLLLGGDQAAALPSWHEPEAVLELATVCVFERIGFHRESIAVQIGSRLRGAERVRYLDMPTIQVSSTMLRRRVAEGIPIRYLAPDKVIERIEAKELYRAPTRVAAG